MIEVRIARSAFIRGCVESKSELLRATASDYCKSEIESWSTYFLWSTILVRVSFIMYVVYGCSGCGEVFVMC